MILEYLHVDCQCMSVGCAIRFVKDEEDKQVWVEFQTYRSKSFWRRLRDAYHVLFKKEPKNWTEIFIEEVDAEKIANFLYSISTNKEDKDRADHGVYS